MPVLNDLAARRRERWIDCLLGYRYSIGPLPGTREHGDVEVALRAELHDAYSPLSPILEVEEVWCLGAHDPDGLRGTTAQGCFLRRARWHAQIYEPQPDPPVGAMRIDLKRGTEKSPLHVHPLGAPNKVWVELAELPEIEVWIARVEQALYERLLDLQS